jgi:hypothetical protein
VKRRGKAKSGETRHIAGGTDLAQEIEAFRKRAGQGSAHGWKWNRRLE